MGLFKKKSDPLTERERDLQRQISSLETEIRRLAELQSRLDEPGEPSAGTVVPTAGSAPVSSVAAYPLKPDKETIPKLGGTSPRLRSTAHPHGPTVSNPKAEVGAPGAAAELTEAVFEESERNPFRGAEPIERVVEHDLGIRREGLVSSWQRLKNHLRGPVTNNPKLVNYLAAGSIHGLRPLRYEKRVARNRFIVLVGVLLLVLWGILALVLKR